MNTYNINDVSFKNSEVYKSFINDYPVNGYLKIRAYSASGAIPVRGLKIVVSTNYQDNKIIFYDGITDTSGIIEILMTTQRSVYINSPNGKKLDKLQKVLNIVVLDDGTVKKVVVK
jgi:hypothetical protein